MAPGPHRLLSDDFMEDYFAEADEHIVAARRNLLLLEPAVGADLPGGVIDDLFRSFHSLKGISAMVELRDAELLAHHMESALRGLRAGEVALTPARFETLVDGAKALEEVIAAHRGGRPAPPIDAVAAHLDELARADRPGAMAPDGPAGGTDREGGRSTGAGVWKVVFTPTPELVNRGVKVDTIRTRLLEIGRVLRVTPSVLASGGISFEFEVETDQEAQIAGWRAEGVTCEALGRPTVAAGNAAVETGTRPGGEFSSSPVAKVVRVDLGRLDDLMRLVGDMVVTRARLDDTLQRIERYVPFQEWRAAQEHAAGLERQLRDLREGVMRVRLVPIGEVFRRMPFVVRDLARDSGKRVQLDLAGQDTEIDKLLIERIMDPVLHLVRNAISHGIEPPAERIAAEKAADGAIHLGASTTGESVVLEIADDGRGIDAEAVAARARAQGLQVPEGPIDAAGLLEILCTSGFSTRDEADRASGRGVGMAVVRGAVQELGGTVAMQTERGQGTTFRITLPLTLAITDAIIATVGDQRFAVPQAAVREVIEVDTTLVRTIEHNELMPHRGGTLPLVRLARLFGLPVVDRPRLHAVVLGTGRGALGIVFDRIEGQREIVVKTIVDPLIRVEGVSGATELGDGRLVLILDVAAIGRTLRERPVPAQGLPA